MYRKSSRRIARRDTHWDGGGLVGEEANLNNNHIDYYQGGRNEIVFCIKWRERESWRERERKKNWKTRKY